MAFLFSKLVAFFLGTFTCFVLHQEFQVPVVLAGAITGLAGSFWHYPKRFDPHPQAAVYAGAFAGMCSAQLIGGYVELAAVAALGAVLYTLSRPLFHGFGGRLGTISFIAVALVLLIKGFV
ncbi:hypothetical protein [Alteromonas sp. 14N.309.X.WAT.G.H12]|uniref:hypothetical protein n=1 Tax=Alteromonas sp. 14N.309.X.WAT.G.H12 TaxID=3120824 RepID=UPI002FD6FF6A